MMHTIIISCSDAIAMNLTLPSFPFFIVSGKQLQLEAVVDKFLLLQNNGMGI